MRERVCGAIPNSQIWNGEILAKKEQVSVKDSTKD